MKKYIDGKEFEKKFDFTLRSTLTGELKETRETMSLEEAANKYMQTDGSDLFMAELESGATLYVDGMPHKSVAVYLEFPNGMEFIIAEDGKFEDECIPLRDIHGSGEYISRECILF
jgi:hypothetical protein